MAAAAAVSFNSLICLNTAGPQCQKFSKTRRGASEPKATHLASPSRMFVSNSQIRVKNCRLSLFGINMDRLVTKTHAMGSENAKTSYADDQSSAASETNLQDQEINTSNGSMTSSDPKLESTPRKSRLTAREKLKAARVLSRYSESKPSKTELGSTVLAALRESDKGKQRSGLPEAPTNLFDDSKRGMPKKGLTFELPVGWDVFLIIASVVFISTVMFTTTFIVWKVGAIHFNEY